MDINELNDAQTMLAENDRAVLTDLAQWLEDSEAVLAALLDRLPSRRPTDASMLVNRLRSALSYPRTTDVPLLLNQYQPPAGSNSTTPPEPVMPSA